MNSTTVLADVHVGSEVLDVDPGSLHAVLRQVTDHRDKRGRRYEAAVILVLIVLAKMAGEKTMSGIAHWAKLRKAWLCQVLPLERIPCANTYSYVCAHIDVAELNTQLGVFAARSGQKSQDDTVRQEGETAEESPSSAPREHLACDGKELRGTYRRGQSISPMQGALGIYNVTGSYMETMLPIEGKGCEGATLTAYLKQRNCRHCLITADALHTQRSMCRQIRQQQGDYLLVVKRNQRALYEDIRYLFSMPPNFWFPEQTTSTTDGSHGRIEVRHIRTTCELNDYLGDRWPGVAQVFQVERHITRRGKTSCETVCGFTSLSPQAASPKQLLAFLRAHWEIENRNHWRRDATLGEDACKVSSGPVAIVLAALNNAILALFDRLHFSNARAAIRTFAAQPERALAIICGSG